MAVYDCTAGGLRLHCWKVTFERKGFFLIPDLSQALITIIRGNHRMGPHTTKLRDDAESERRFGEINSPPEAYEGTPSGS